MAVPVFVVSAAAVAVTVTDRLLDTDAGGVYTPAEEIEPQEEVEHETVQVTAVLLDPVTVAVNAGRPVVAPAVIVAVAGATVTLTGGGLTVTVAVAFLVVSAAAVAVTVTARALLTEVGGVYTPAEEIEPQEEVEHETVQVTDVLLDPETVAVKVGRPVVAPAVTVAVAGDSVMLTVPVLVEDVVVELLLPPPQASNEDKITIVAKNPTHARVLTLTLLCESVGHSFPLRGTHRACTKSGWRDSGGKGRYAANDIRRHPAVVA